MRFGGEMASRAIRFGNETALAVRRGIRPEMALAVNIKQFRRCKYLSGGSAYFRGPLFEGFWQECNKPQESNLPKEVSGQLPPPTGQGIRNVLLESPGSRPAFGTGPE